MQTLNFNCSHCGKLMAVGMNLLGRNVRCPHCKQVVQAPATAGPPVAAPELPTMPEPSFQLPAQPKESHESIFGEVHDDDVFGTRAPKVKMPNEPVATPNRPVEQEPTLEMPSQSAGRDVPTYSPPPKTETLPDSAPATINPWDGPSSPPSHTPPRTEPNEFSETKRPYAPRERASESGGGGGILVWILLAYSAAATAGVAYLYFNRTTSSDKPNESNTQGAHPFSAIPDFFGHYDKANRKEVVRPKGMPDPKQDVPEKLRVNLKSTLSVGNIEVTPTRIEYRDVTRFDKTTGKAKFEKKGLSRPLFLLHLRVKNHSEDVVLHPTDPAFNAKYRADLPYTGIFVGGDHFLGGPWIWPDAQYEHQYLEGQENDGKPLGPNEERDFVIGSTIESDKILHHLRTMKDGDSALWHVQLRKGLDVFTDETGMERDVSVTCVIGVPFTIADVKFAN